MPAVWTSQEFSIGNQPQCQVISSRPSTACSQYRAFPLRIRWHSSSLPPGRPVLQHPPSAAPAPSAGRSPLSSNPWQPSIFRPGVGALHLPSWCGCPPSTCRSGRRKRPWDEQGVVPTLRLPPSAAPPPPSFAFRHPMALRRLHPQPRARAPPPNPCTTLAPPLLHPQIQRRRWRRRPRGERGAAPPLIFFPPR
jgi:hypothetical protein